MLSGILSSYMNKKSQVEIEEGFEKNLSMYPTEGLIDLYEMEGYRDSKLEEEDRGVWWIYSNDGLSKIERKNSKNLVKYFVRG